MRVDSINSYNSQPQFGHVIKTRFFEVLPDKSKTQIQDVDTIKTLCKRLTYHLGCPHRTRKDRIHGLGEKKTKKEYYSIILENGDSPENYIETEERNIRNDIIE